MDAERCEQAHESGHRCSRSTRAQVVAVQVEKG
jgi:hypothetical protein